MAHVVKCPNCEQPYSVIAEHLGQRARCKNCGETFTLKMSLDETRQGANRPIEGPAPLLTLQPVRPQGDTPEPEVEPADRPVMAASQPIRIGPYLVRRKLGGGAMGEVWLAHDPDLERDVAIKTLRPEHAQDVEYLKRFLGEARNAARLQHPNTVTIFQVGAKGDLAYLVMELVDGESLDKSVTPERSMEWREATRVIRDAAAGLAAAHEKGLVHRDIKPANLMRTTSGTTKVVDFGLARAQTANSHLTQQGMLLGTPQYMAPELWAGAEADPRSDVYALLVCYYYLLTGRVPFDAPSLPVLGYRHRYDPLPDPRQSAKGLPDAACRILGRGLAKDPARRYQRCDELVAELEALLSSPQASLTFESSWAVLVGEHTAVTPPPVIQVVSTPPLPSPARVRNPRGNPLSWAARRAWRALRGVGPAVRKSVLSLARRASEGGASEGEAPKFPRWRVGLVCLASLAMLGIVVYVTTGSGTVKIELSDPNAEVQVQVDGDTIDITGLKEPLRLRVGAHELEVSCTEFQTLTKSFTVRRGQEDVVKVTLQPVPPALPLAEKPAPAVYSVTVDPPTAKVAVAGKGASIEGSGASRTITVTEPDGQGKVVVMASLAGYDTQEQEIQPEPGISRQLSLQLKPLPAVYRVTVDPPTASVSVTGKSASIEGSGPSRTITVKEPDGQGKVLVVAGLLGYKAIQQELQPRGGMSGPLALQLKPLAPGTVFENSLGMKLAYIPAGEFLMGSPESDNYAGLDEKPQHRVRITKPFYLGVYEVTQAQYQKVVGSNPSQFKGESLPVETVSWDEAVEFCKRLSEVAEERAAGRTYRLPTEAEWEYACRAGSTSKYSFGDSEAELGQHAWYDQNSGNTTHPVGGKSANAWGLYDMHGNVWEWCQDWHGAYGAGPASDSSGPGSASFRVLRGGAWLDSGRNCRSAYRRGFEPGFRIRGRGFRVAGVRSGS